MEDDRYSRQTLFAPIGAEGQARIAQSRVLLVGCGALGTHLAEVMVRAGVATLTIVDRDIIESSNLQRQSLFTEDDVRAGLPKAVAAQRHLAAINERVRVEAVVGDFQAKGAEDLARGMHLLLDGTDNFETRFLLNDLSVKLDIPWIYTACVSATASCMPIVPGKSACLDCMLEGLPAAGGETCDTVGIVMPAVLAAVSMAGTEALKFLSGRADQVLYEYRIMDCWRGISQGVRTDKPRPGCATCDRREFASLSGRRSTQAVALCGRNSVQMTPASALVEGLDAVARRVGARAKVLSQNAYLLQLEAEGVRLTLFRDGRCLIAGTSELERARAIYARIVGN